MLTQQIGSGISGSPVARQSDELTVFAAASLTEAFQKLGAGFEATHPNVKMRFNFGGSQQLVQQIIHGARCDILASANFKQMNLAAAAGTIDSATIRAFAGNRLVMIAPKENPARLTDFQDLSKPNIKIVLADSSVPAGLYSRQVIDKASSPDGFGNSFAQRVTKNIVSYEENVRAVLSKVRLGECDAGIVYESDLSNDSTHHVLRINIPEKFNLIAEYPIAVVNGTNSLELSRQFIKYVLSEEGVRILASFGFSQIGRAGKQ